MKTDLNLASPLMNAAGALGFAPPSHGSLEHLNMGAFITNPVSLQER